MRQHKLHFAETVPDRHRTALEEAYDQYCRQSMICLFNDRLQIILCEWVSCGNDPFRSNRYGFYDSQKQEYLDFMSGERKARQICRIMTGQCEAAVCGYNQYGEPLPQKGLVKVPQGGLLDEIFSEIQSGIIKIQGTISESR